VSYFEWVQNRSGYYWSEQMVNRAPDGDHGQLFAEVLKLSKLHKVNMPRASYMLAISRVSTVHKLRGIYA